MAKEKDGFIEDIKEAAGKTRSRLREGLGGFLRDTLDDLVDTGKSVATAVREDVREHGGLLPTVRKHGSDLVGAVKDTYNAAVDKYGQPAIDRFSTDGRYDAEKTKDTLKAMMDRGITGAKQVYERAVAAGDNFTYDADLFLTDTEKKKSPYKGIGLIKVMKDNKVRRHSRGSIMTRPEFDAVLEYDTEVGETIPAGRQWKAKIRKDIKYAAVTSTEELLRVYTTHPDFKNTPETEKKIKVVEAYLK